jgi:signal transduction histidine kinase/ligand-binding sensor domain-containing protein
LPKLFAIGSYAERRRGLACCALALALTQADVIAEQRPFRAFTTADGLAHDRVASITSDSNGFVWFSTANGLSRFDGSRFVNYGAAQGLPDMTIGALLELEGGAGYLVATNGAGVAWYRPDNAVRHAPRFQLFPVSTTDGAANRVNVLHRGSRRLWAGTDAGLFEISRDGDTLVFTRVDVSSSSRGDPRIHVLCVAEDSAGTLWVGTATGLIRLPIGGPSKHYAIHASGGTDQVYAVLPEPNGDLWVGHRSGLFTFDGAHGATTRRYTTRDGLSDDWVRALYRGSDGAIWIGTMEGVTRWQAGRFSTSGLPALPVNDITGDRHGNVWIAVIAGGVLRLSATGLTTFTTADGLSSPYARGFVETRDGRVAIVARRDPSLSFFDGERFSRVSPRLSAGATAADTANAVAFLHDRASDWWISTGSGLARYTGLRSGDELATRAPSAVYTVRDGLAGIDVWRLFEDSRGDIWIATRTPTDSSLTRWERRTSAFHRYTTQDGLPAGRPIGAFAEDRNGQLWVGFWDGGAARLRNGRFESVAGVSHPVMGWHVAPSGTLWGATLGMGLIRIDRPDAATIALTTLGTRDGLPTDRFVALVDDAAGNLYAASTIGVTRIDAASGAIAQYTQEHGLARSEVHAAFRDRTGALWFASDGGVSRLLPRDAVSASSVQLLIGAARVNGASLPIADLGATTAGPFVLDASQRHVEIDFIPLGAGSASGVQYRLEGADREWTNAGGRRSVDYARLASGSYRFVVRAPHADGWAEASLAFSIERPIWQRAWFILSMCAAGAILLIAVHRTRVARLVAVERMRTRIASDLHDDIGTNLSQIAILGELLKRQIGDHPAQSSLNRIADLSRESIDSLSDIVWSIDPDKDHLSNLSTRMRRLASELLSSRDIAFTFAVDGDADLTVAAEIRRNLFLAFKETLNNIVRHADSRNVAIQLRLDRGQLSFEVHDDGRGFDDTRASGHGLTSLKRRAERLGGTVFVTSSPGHGTNVVMSVPNHVPTIPT